MIFDRATAAAAAAATDADHRLSTEPHSRCDVIPVDAIVHCATANHVGYSGLCCRGERGHREKMGWIKAVSYTHLTLPTKRIV